MKGVVEGLEIGVELVFHLAGQEAELLAGLYGGSAEDDLTHLLVLQRAHGQGDGDEGLARSGGPDGEGEVVLLKAIDEQLLIGRAGGDGATIDAIDDQVILRGVRQLVALDQVDDHLLRERVTLGAVALDLAQLTQEDR